MSCEWSGASTLSAEPDEARRLIDELADLLPVARRYLHFVRAYPSSQINLAIAKRSVETAELAIMRLQQLASTRQGG